MPGNAVVCTHSWGSSLAQGMQLLQGTPSQQTNPSHCRPHLGHKAQDPKSMATTQLLSI
jgi:hypothetical protein